MTIISNRLYTTVLDMEKAKAGETENKYVYYLYCFNTENGQQIFKTPITSTTDAYLYQDYLIVGSQINYEKGKTNEFGDTWLYGDFGFNILNKTTGKLLYHYPLDSKWISSPVFYKDFCVIVTDDRSVYFFDLKQQKLITKYGNKTEDRDPYPSVSSLVLHKNLVFSIQDPRFELVAYNIETGKIVWRKIEYQKENETYQIFYKQPFIYNNSLVCFTNCCQNSLLWISPETGELQRISRMTYPGYPDLVISSDAQPTVIGNQLFLIDSYAKFPDLPIVPDKTWEYPKTLFCYNLDDLNLQYITEIHPNDYHANTVQLSSGNDFVIETGNCLYLIDKNTGQYKDFLFFNGFNEISKFTEIMSWKEK